MGRAHARSGFDNETRVTLLEDDADKIESTVVSLQKSMQRVSSALIGAALTFGTSAVLFALNLIVSA